MHTQFLHVTHKSDEVRIPYIEIEGKTPGPHIFISGGLHGNEINGVAAVEAFLSWANEIHLAEKLAGKITVLPVLNPSGFAHVYREVYEDKKDPNRAFGVESPSTFSEVIAKSLTENILRHCEFGIDIHDAGDRYVLLPHTRVHKSDSDVCDTGCTKQLGRLFGTEIIIEREGHPHMMAVHLYQKYDIPVLTVEIGGAQHIFPLHIKQALRGIRNILTDMKMYDSGIIVPSKQYLLRDRFGLRTNAPALLQFSIELGDFVHAGDTLGSAYYPLSQKHEDLIAPVTGYVFSLQLRNQVPACTVMYSILEVPEHGGEKKIHGKMFDELSPFDVTKYNFSAG